MPPNIQKRRKEKKNKRRRDGEREGKKEEEGRERGREAGLGRNKMRLQGIERLGDKTRDLFKDTPSLGFSWPCVTQTLPTFPITSRWTWHSRIFMVWFAPPPSETDSILTWTRYLTGHWRMAAPNSHYPAQGWVGREARCLESWWKDHENPRGDLLGHWTGQRQWRTYGQMLIINMRYFCTLCSLEGWPGAQGSLLEIWCLWRADSVKCCVCFTLWIPSVLTHSHEWGLLMVLFHRSMVNAPWGGQCHPHCYSTGANQGTEWFGASPRKMSWIWVHKPGTLCP